MNHFNSHAEKIERTNIKFHNFCLECTKYYFNPDWIMFSAVTETQHLPEMAADMHKEKMIKQEGNQVFLPPNPLEDYSEADNDISGYEDEYSVGIDLPLATEITSGNIYILIENPIINSPRQCYSYSNYWRT